MGMEQKPRGQHFDMKRSSIDTTIHVMGDSLFFANAELSLNDAEWLASLTEVEIIASQRAGDSKELDRLLIIDRNVKNAIRSSLNWKNRK